MTEAARWNLQHGVPEDKSYEWTDYTPTSDLDRWILSRIKMRKKFDQRQQEIQFQKELEKEIEDKVYKTIDQALADLLAGFNKR